MARVTQKLVPGIVGISTYIDGAYHMEIQRTALAASGEPGPIDRLRAVMAALDFKLLLDNLFSGNVAAAEEQVAAAAAAIEAGGGRFHRRDVGDDQHAHRGDGGARAAQAVLHGGHEFVTAWRSA